MRSKAKKAGNNKNATTNGVIMYIKIARPMHAKLAELAESEDKTMGAMVRQALKMAYGF